MATKATIKGYLNGYPNTHGNKKEAVAVMKGPTDYIADGVLMQRLGHIYNIHHMFCSGGMGAAGARYGVIPIFTVNPPTPIELDKIRLIFIDLATGVEPANATDLSAVEFVMTVYGTN